MDAQTEEERAAFEASVLGFFQPAPPRNLAEEFKERGDGAYKRLDLQLAWCAWQAARSAPAHPAEGVQSVMTHAEASAALAINSALHRIREGNAAGAIEPLEQARAVLANVAATQPAAQGLDAQDLDAWPCEKCHGTGIHKFDGYGDSPRGQYPITEREECDDCNATGWCGPDAALAAQAKQGGAA